MIKKTIIILLAHYLIYPFYLDGISNTIQQLLIFGSVFLYGFINFNSIIAIFRNMKSAKKSVILLIIFCIFIVASSFFIPIINGTNDMSYLSTIIRTSVYISLYTILISMVRKNIGNEEVKNKLIEIYVKVTRNYVLVTILFLLIPTLQNIWFNLIKIPQNNLDLISQPKYFARVGWAGYSGFSNTFYCTIAVILGIYLLFDYYVKNKKINKGYLLSVLLSLVGNAFYGRSGLLISLAVLGLSILFFAIIYKKFGIVLSILSGIIIAFISLYVLKDYNETLLEWYTWMLEPIISIIETGTIRTTSTNTLWSMWFLPDLDTIILGDGFYTSPVTGGYYMGTDVGYLRPILFFGLFFTVINYIIPLIFSYSIFKGNREDKFLALLLIFSFFLFEIKGEVITRIIPILFVIYIGHNLKEANSLHNFNCKKRKQLMKGNNYEFIMGGNKQIY